MMGVVFAHDFSQANKKKCLDLPVFQSIFDQDDNDLTLSHSYNRNWLHLQNQLFEKFQPVFFSLLSGLLM